MRKDIYRLEYRRHKNGSNFELGQYSELGREQGVFGDITRWMLACIICFTCAPSYQRVEARSLDFGSGRSAIGVCFEQRVYFRKDKPSVILRR